MKQTEQAKIDRKLIDGLGGCAKVAEMLGIDNTNQDGTRFIYSWYRNGIPAKWKLKHKFLIGGNNETND